MNTQVATAIGAVALGIVTASFSAVRADGGGEISFRTAFVHLFVMFSVFNVVDLVLLDWPLVTICPRFMVLPGTEGSAGYQRRESVADSLKGFDNESLTALGDVDFLDYVRSNHSVDRIVGVRLFEGCLNGAFKDRLDLLDAGEVVNKEDRSFVCDVERQYSNDPVPFNERARTFLARPLVNGYRRDA